MEFKFIKFFDEVQLKDLSLVGGKNASLGEMYNELTQKGVNVPNGFAVTSKAYWQLLDDNQLREQISNTLKKLDSEHYSNLSEVGKEVRSLLSSAKIPEELESEIKQAFEKLNAAYPESIEVAVRSSATAEDLPQASFAGQQESFLNIKNPKQLINACKECFTSLFTDRAIKYREDNHFEHMQVALSIGVQKMVRSDLASAGVCFTIDPETGFDNIIMISSSWGLGENVVKGNVTPDEFYIFKTALKNGKYPIISRKIGLKEKTMTYASKDTDHASKSTANRNTPKDRQDIFSLEKQDVIQIAKWASIIEEHYKTPMDIEWAKDGITGELFIVQARPETIHSQAQNQYRFSSYKLAKGNHKPLVEGKNVGDKITSGKVRVLHDPSEINKLQKGEVLVTGITNPDWDPVLKKASAIITDRGGRTSHAAIVARECGAIAVVGTQNATKILKDGQTVTVSCAEGKKGIVYDGEIEWKETQIDTRDIILPKTQVMFILADPDQAFKLSSIPNNGVGLTRIEFAINNAIQIHPLALIHFDKLKNTKVKKEIEKLTTGYPSKEQYFVEKLSEAVGTIAAAFYPKDVIVRMSDFKSNEYANLIGGKQFEPHEENPMLGWRGASRYYHENYKEGFRLECEAMKRVRDDMGLTNVKLMIPFCRTVEEGKKVIDIMKSFGLEQGKNNLEIYVMVEIPSNVILADEFAEIFDGFSIGSNDLTQLTLGIGRDSEILTELFDTNNQAVKDMISLVIQKAKKNGTKIGLCGQAPSDFPEFAQFLVSAGIDSISFSPDAILKGIENICIAEKKS